MSPRVTFPNTKTTQPRELSHASSSEIPISIANHGAVRYSLALSTPPHGLVCAMTMEITANPRARSSHASAVMPSR